MLSFKTYPLVRTGLTCLKRDAKTIVLTRHASQLYPSTSQRWDDVMIQAESIVGDASNFSSLQKWVSGEFINITKYLQKLIGSNHPMLETAKRCTYISEGRMGSAQARGITVILTAKLVEELAKPQIIAKPNLIHDQISLAEMTEMTYSAYMIHRGVMDLSIHGVESVDFIQKVDMPESGLNAQQAKGIHYGNKVSILCGDFLLAYVMRGLGDLFSSKVVDLVASAITDFMEGEFLLIDDWTDRNYLLSERSRDVSRWIRRSQSTIGSLQGNTCQGVLVLAGVDEQLQKHALEFGRNLGLAWQAHTEVQPLLTNTYEPIKLPEMPEYPSFDLNSLPVILFMKQAFDSSGGVRLLVDDLKAKAGADGGSIMNQHRHQETVDYEKLHSMIVDQKFAINETFKIVENYSRAAINHLEHFPASPARRMLQTICESLYKR